MVWDFWHEQSSECTDTTKLAKLRNSCRKKNESGLPFQDSVEIVHQRGKEFYQCMWKLVHSYKIWRSLEIKLKK